MLLIAYAGAISNDVFASASLIEERENQRTQSMACDRTGGSPTNASSLAAVAHVGDVALDIASRPVRRSFRSGFWRNFRSAFDHDRL